MNSWMTQRRGIAALVLATLAFAGCGGGGDETTSEQRAAGAEAAPNAVVMRLIAFKPESISVPAGTTVTWTQTDAGFHTVTSGTVNQGSSGVTTAPDGTFESGNLATDETFEFTFEEPGTFPYFCANHPATMRATVQVT